MPATYLRLLSHMHYAGGSGIDARMQHRWRALIFLSLIGLISLPSFAYFDETTPALVTFTGYKPMYFVIGSPDTKVQVSFKAQLLTSVPIYFGYTQLMMWDLFKDSAPFRDINYNPDVFYRLNFGPPENGRWLDFAPLEHESNGRDSAISRSWNRAYVRYTNTAVIEAGTQKKIHWSVKASLPFSVDSNNRDYAQYRGIFEGTITFSQFFGPFWDRNDLTLRIYPGGAAYINPLLGGQELTFRGNLSAQSFLPSIVLQIFHGYAENMLDYQQERWGFRAGIGF